MYLKQGYVSACPQRRVIKQDPPKGLYHVVDIQQHYKTVGNSQLLYTGTVCSASNPGMDPCTHRKSLCIHFV